MNIKTKINFTKICEILVNNNRTIDDIKFIEINDDEEITLSGDDFIIIREKDYDIDITNIIYRWRFYKKD